MQVNGRALHTFGVLRHAAEHVALAHALALGDAILFRVHVQVVIERAVVALQCQHGPVRAVHDNAVDHRHCVPFAVFALGRADILAAVTVALRAERHDLARVAHFAVVVTLQHRIVVARIALASTDFDTAPAAAEPADLRIHMHMVRWREAKRIDDAGQVDLAVTRAPASGVFGVQFARGKIGKTTIGVGGRRRRDARRWSCGSRRRNDRRRRRRCHHWLAERAAGKPERARDRQHWDG